MIQLVPPITQGLNSGVRGVFVISTMVVGRASDRSVDTPTNVDNIYKKVKLSPV